MDKIYDDQPSYGSFKKNKESKRTFQKGGMYMTFVPEEPKSEEYMAQQRHEFALLLAKRDTVLDRKAIEFATILLQGFNRD